MTGTSLSSSATLVPPLDPVLAALADGRLVREVTPPFPGSVKLSPVPVGFALTGDQLTPFDITATAVGEQELKAFTERLAGYGIETGGMSFTVYTLPPVQEAVAAARQI